MLKRPLTFQLHFIAEQICGGVGPKDRQKGSHGASPQQRVRGEHLR